MLEALESGYGESIRYSDTLMQQHIYAMEQLPDGTGLGLSIIKHAVQILHADLTLHSIPDQGTSITVTFPQNTEQAAH